MIKVSVMYPNTPGARFDHQYYRDKHIPYHLRLADLHAHLDQLTARRIILTHMSADILDARHETALKQARDGLTITL